MRYAGLFVAIKGRVNISQLDVGKVKQTQILCGHLSILETHTNKHTDPDPGHVESVQECLHIRVDQVGHLGLLKLKDSLRCFFFVGCKDEE